MSCFFFFRMNLYSAKVFGLIHWIEKAMLNIANFGGKIHNVMCKKQSEVRWKTILLSCILTISTGSIPGHDLSFGLCIQVMAFSNISSSLFRCPGLFSLCYFILNATKTYLFTFPFKPSPLPFFFHSALHPTTQKIQFSSFQAFWIQMTYCSLEPAICASHWISSDLILYWMNYGLTD